MQWTEMLIAVVSGFALTIMAMPIVIGFFRTKQLGQTTRDEGPKWHEVKTGTPTMGGLIFIIPTFVITLILLRILSSERFFPNKKICKSFKSILFINKEVNDTPINGA